MLDIVVSSQKPDTTEIRVLIASVDFSFTDRFQKAFSARGAHVSFCEEGFEALTMLETSRYSILFFNGGYPDSSEPGLLGIGGNELAHMWRQIERRGEHMTIACVSLSASSGFSRLKSRFFLRSS